MSPSWRRRGSYSGNPSGGNSYGGGAAAAVGGWLLCLVFTAGCFRHTVEERQLPNAAYLRFPRLESRATVTLSGPRDYEFQVPAGSSQRYEVEAGQYRVTVTRGGELVADKLVYLGAGEVKEVDAR